MTLIFYFAPYSAAVSTQAVLAELDIPHEVKTLKLGDGGDTKSTEFLALNPNGTIPLIVHNGNPVFESAAIAIYLGETFGVDKGLFPRAGSPQRGAAIQWIVWATVVLDAAARNMTLPDTKERGAETVNKALRILDGVFGKNDYLAGQEYTLADTHLSTTVHWLQALQIDFTPFPTLQKWIGRLDARPALRSIRE
ncbi:hypothetical protein HDU87_001565 [Geranomyces variabilis]|uniref:Glutathione S-transferase n=1 Tax=Geranomyces variabilis TaxID=109894 RepID=A0AAD5TMF8_9FUNG|nr:hypothetical protein HDU87_001565 [Geranomyces variabilis]